MIQRTRFKPITAGLYLLLAFGITWTFVVPLVASSQGWSGFAISPYWHAVGAAGPFAAAVYASRLEGSLALLWYRMSLISFPRWLWFAALSPLLMTVPAALVVGATTGELPDLGRLGESDLGTAGALLFGALVPAVAYGIGEETGWRGFLLPRVQDRLGPWAGTAALSVVYPLVAIGVAVVLAAAVAAVAGLRAGRSEPAGALRSFG